MNNLIEPTLKVEDIGGQSTTIVAPTAVAEALRDHARQTYADAIKQLAAAGPNPEFDWEAIMELQSLLGTAGEAVAVIRSTTADPEVEANA
jgi:hypothetical protein